MHDENGDLVLAEKSYLRALEINPDHGMLLNKSSCGSAEARKIP